MTMTMHTIKIQIAKIRNHARQSQRPAGWSLASQAKLSLTSGGAARGERLADAVTVAGGLRVGAAVVHALGYAHPRGEALPAVRVARLVAIAELVGHGSHQLQLAVAGQQDDEQAADSNSFLPLHSSAQHRFTPAHATELVLAVRKRG
jgi:hypothetical protein